MVALSLNFHSIPNNSSEVFNTKSNRKYPKNDIDTKILIYEDRVKNWFFIYGENLQEDLNSGFVVLQIAITQIEGIQQYKIGNSSDGNSCEIFKRGIKEIFSLDHSYNDLIVEFYKQCRCGLFHDGMTRENVLIKNSFNNALEFNGSKIMISPNKFFNKILDYFNKYLNDLKDRNNLQLRSNFNNIFQI